MVSICSVKLHGICLTDRMAAEVKEAGCEKMYLALFQETRTADYMIIYPKFRGTPHAAHKPRYCSLRKSGFARKKCLVKNGGDR